ncbi:hypothetical protein SNE40_002417 [Patella caerulea]|uniref:WAP domain-containing protein n=1 Tax=Patella caerulea TaxID=87958 RepID=A0AAN8K128_PATCE
MFGIFCLASLLVLVSSCDDACTGHECNGRTCKLKYHHTDCVEPPCFQGTVTATCLNLGEDPVNPCKFGTAFIDDNNQHLNCSQKNFKCPHGSVCETDPNINWALCCSRCHNPGSCPVVKQKHTVSSLCKKECELDGDCGVVKKCCFNGCGQTCVDPKFKKGI